MQESCRNNEHGKYCGGMSVGKYTQVDQYTVMYGA